MQPDWLAWALRLQAIAQNGLAFAEAPYDVERYSAVRQIAAEMMAAGSGEDVKRVLDWMATDTGYATPKVGVRGVVFQDDRLLFVKERVDDRWTLPGGWTEPGESASESVVREIREESGFQTRPVKLLAVYDRQRHPLPPHPYHVYVIYFRCELLGGEPAESLETNGVAFFDEAAAGNLPLGRVTPQQVARMFDHRRHPEWPADFD